MKRPSGAGGRSGRGDAPRGKPAHGKPTHGKPAHGKPAHGKPAHGKPAHGKAQHAAGKPSPQGPARSSPPRPGPGRAAPSFGPPRAGHGPTTAEGTHTSPRVPIPHGPPRSGAWLWTCREDATSDLVDELRATLGDAAKVRMLEPGLVESRGAPSFLDGTIDVTLRAKAFRSRRSCRVRMRPRWPPP